MYTPVFQFLSRLRWLSICIDRPLLPVKASLMPTNLHTVTIQHHEKTVWRVSLSRIDEAPGAHSDNIRDIQNLLEYATRILSLPQRKSSRHLTLPCYAFKNGTTDKHSDLLHNFLTLFHDVKYPRQLKHEKLTKMAEYFIGHSVDGPTETTKGPK